MLDIFNNINDFLWTYILIVPLIAIGIWFTCKTKFVQFRNFKEMFRLLVDKNPADITDPNKKPVSSFQTFCISTASRVGTGNLAGIAIAITVGGPGAVFWMWLVALISAASSFIESTLAQLYKEPDGKGSFVGGPAYYMEKALNMKWLGVIFSILITLCFGFVFNSVQSNTISLALNEAFSFPIPATAVVLTVVTAVIIFGGIKRIAKISEIIVPVMAIAYILIALLVMVLNITKLPGVIGLIFSNAFSFEAFSGGTLGGIILTGVKRGLFSNEAGMGSAPNVAATAEVSHPVKQGLVQTLGVFTDTLLICSCTAFIVLLGLDGAEGIEGLSGIQLTQRALDSQIGGIGSKFIAICVLMFAFSSIVGNYYYGETNIEFLTSNSLVNRKIYLIIYRAGVALMVLAGALVSMDTVWVLADIFMACMAIINLFAIVLLGKQAFRLLEDYNRQRKEGKDPVFKASSMPDLYNISAWQD